MAIAIGSSPPSETRWFRAFRARDARFDGLVYLGASSTGIYCRPVCPARTPRRQNCRFFSSAAAAEKAGFRPCLRCRPELAPGSAPVDSVERLAVRAARRIEDGALAQSKLEALAAELGVTSRHLRRAVTRSYGVTPIELAQTQRLLFAKRLLQDTSLPVTEIAFAAGFASVRRFNALFKQRYRLAPSALRRRAEPAPEQGLRFELAFRPPLAWRPLLSFLATRAIPGVERVVEGRYLRSCGNAEHPGWVEVAALRERPALAVRVAPELSRSAFDILQRVKRVFDLFADPSAIDAHLRRDPRFAASVRRRPGMRVPGAFDGFELAVRAITGQQISVAGATTLAGRFASAFGVPLRFPRSGLTHLTPTPERVGEASVDAIARLGLVRRRAQAIRAVARALCDGTVRLEPGVDPTSAIESLCTLPGVGPWTAEYIAMRALAWPDALPAADLALRRALSIADPRALRDAAEAWRPWRAYAVMHLWHNYARPAEVSS